MIRTILLSLALPMIASAQLEGVFDLHVHSAPDSGPRSIDAIEVAQLARRHGMRGLLLKNHYSETASMAYLVSRVVPEVEAYGGIVLNRAVGGINPSAVEHLARKTGGLGKVVWMPTFDSEHYHRVSQPNPKHVPVAKDGALLPETLAVLDVMARLGLALATGHSSPEESLLLIRAAKQRGIERIIVTHPGPAPVAMSIELQKQAAALGAFLEYPFSPTLPPNPHWPGGTVPMDEYLRMIREVGPEHVILTSDLGQAMNPTHTDGLKAFQAALREASFSAAEIDRMGKVNPARFLGLE